MTGSGDVKAQSFTFTPLGSNHVSLPFIPDSIQIVKHQGIVHNNTANPINFRFARIVNNQPLNWYTQMCYDLCYASFVDTISLTSDAPYTLAPHQIDTLFYIDFTCEGQGLGTSVVKMYNTNNPAEFDQETFSVQVGDVGVYNISNVVEGYELSQNYPNPFNPVTNITFSIPVLETVTLKVYDILGNEVAVLVNNEKLAGGKYKVDFNAGQHSSGIYYYTIKTESFVDTKKMILLK